MAQGDLTPRQQNLIKPKAEKLFIIEGAYRRAAELVKSPAWQETRTKALQDVVFVVNSYKPGEDASKATYVLGQLKEILTGVDGPMKLIREYESIKESIVKIEQGDFE